MNSLLLPLATVTPAAIYSLLTLWCGRQFFNSRSDNTDSAAETRPITIMKPVKGVDQGSFENFASFCQQQYAGQQQLLFCIADQQDPAVPVIQEVIRRFPEHDISLNINPAIHGPNHKISNLINGFHLVKHDLIMICDSDIRVPPIFFTSVCRHFNRNDLGLVTSPYRSSTVHGPVTAIEGLAFSTEMIPNVVTAIRLEGLSFALGAAMTFRKEALTAIGGLESLVDYLADDYQLGNKIHRAGWRLQMDDLFVESMLRPESLRSIFLRQLRWSRTMRVSRPGGYLASGITLPGLALLLALIVSPPQGVLIATLLLYLIRLVVSTCFSRCYTKDRLLPRWWWLLPLRDLLAFFTWLLAFCGNRVTWRDNRFIIQPDGKLLPD